MAFESTDKTDELDALLREANESQANTSYIKREPVELQEAAETIADTVDWDTWINFTYVNDDTPKADCDMASTDGAGFYSSSEQDANTNFNWYEQYCEVHRQ